MIKLNGSKLIGSVINFIDEKSNGAITNLHNSRYIGNLEEYLLYGWVVIQNPSPYLKPILKMDTLIRLSLANRFSKGYSISRDYSVGFTIPVKTYKAIMDGIYSRSNMLKHLDVIKTDSDRVTVPYNNTQGLRWPGEVPPAYRIVDPEPEYIDINTNVTLLVFTISSKPNQVRARSIEDDYIKSRIGYKNLNNEILDSISSQIAEFIDKSLVSLEPNTEDTVLESILTTPGLFDHESEGMATKGGYIDVHGEIYQDGADSLKAMLFHTIQGYRQRAKWILNSNTGLQIAVAKDGNGNYLIDPRNEALRTVGVPDLLLNKPICYNENMPDVGIVGILADLTRGYVISPSRELRLVIDENEDDITLKMYIGGKVLQPAAFKGYRYIERNEEDLAAIREKTRLANKKWWAEYNEKKAKEEEAKLILEQKEAEDKTSNNVDITYTPETNTTNITVDVIEE